MAWQMWTLLLARSSSLGHPIGAPRVFFLTRNTCSMNVSNQMKSWCTSMNTWTHTCTYIHILAKQRERSEWSEGNDRSLFKTPRYLYIYMSVYTWIARDRAHLKQVLSRWRIVHCPTELWLLFGAPLWGVAFTIGMDDGAISAEDSPDDDSDLSRTHTQEAPGRRQRLGPYAYC